MGTEGAIVRMMSLPVVAVNVAGGVETGRPTSGSAKSVYSKEK